VKRFLRRSWLVTAAVAAAASFFALTALGGSGQVVGGSLSYLAAAGEVNHVTVSVAAGNLLIDDPTGGVTGLAGCSASGTQLNCGPVSALTSPMVINVGDANDSVTIATSVNSTIPSITIVGGSGNDTLTNNSNRQVTFIGGLGNDTLTGNGNNDTVDYSSSPSGVNVDLAAGTATGNGTDTLANIGNVVGSSHDDTIAGNDLANDLQGGPGSDTVDYSGVSSTSANGITLTFGVPLIVPGTTDAGADTLGGFENVIGSHYSDSITGDASNNTIDGGGGGDPLLDGGGGTDTLSYATAPGPVTIDLGTPVQTTGDVIALNSFENLTGSAFSDSLSGDDNVNVLNGGDGDDSLAGRAGADTLNGGAGSNTANYSSATPNGVIASIAAGQASSDGEASPAIDTFVNIQNLTGSGQADTLTGDDGANTINGGGGGDTIVGGSGNDVLNGQNGSGDTIDAGLGNDAIDGGTGSDDTVSYASSISSAASDGVSVDLGAGTASAIGTNDAGHDTVVGLENVTGSPFSDSLAGDPGANTLLGSGGNDSFGFSGGGDTFDGGTGTNSADFSADTSGIALDLSVAGPQAGADNSSLAFIQNVTGTPQSDSLAGDSDMNTINGAGGSDTIDGAGDNDTLSGDAGNDVLTGGSGDDSVSGGDGNDTVSGRSGTDALSGGAGTNTANYGSAAAAINVNLRAGSASIDGDGGNDTLSGFQNVTAPSLAGNVLQGDAGDNVLDSGGAGNATVSFAGAASGVSVDLGAGTASGDGSDTLVAGFDTVTGSTFGDSLTASPGGSTLNGLGGADTLTGGAGIDSLNGGAGDDTMNGGPGVGNSLDGSTGTDTLDYSSATSVVSANLAAGSAVVSYPALAIDILSNIENVTGSPGDDVLMGDGNDNVLRGLGGNDFLQGGGGDDSLQGAAGIDTADFSDSAGGVNVNLAAQSALGDGTDALSSIENASGSSSADQLFGNGGPNTLLGSGGNDQLDGGGGSDVINGGANNDSIYAKDGLVDTVACGGGTDSATVDTIDVVNADCEAAGFLGGPVVRTIEASGITTTGATLNGGVNPDGRAVNFRFRYGPTSAYGTTTPSAPLPASHTESLVSAAVSGLTPGATYHFQLVVTDGLGNETLGNDQSFTTAAVPHSGPVAMTLPANAGDPPHDATLLGSVTTNGVPTTYFFQWGLTVAYGQQTAAQLLGSTAIPVLVWDSIDAKPPSIPLKATIHYRLVATNEFGTSFGNDMSFTTPLKGPPVILSVGGTQLQKPNGRTNLLHFNHH
jgi:Ca2+-binding RTX toxin-like protein